MPDLESRLIRPCVASFSWRRRRENNSETWSSSYPAPGPSAVQSTPTAYPVAGAREDERIHPDSGPGSLGLVFFGDILGRIAPIGQSVALPVTISESGERGIRTLDAFRHTRFRVVRDQPDSAISPHGCTGHYTAFLTYA